MRCVASTLLPRRRHCECACNAALVSRQSIQQCRGMPAASGYAWLYRRQTPQPCSTAMSWVDSAAQELPLPCEVLFAMVPCVCTISADIQT